MDDYKLRKSFGKAARKKANDFSEKEVNKKWKQIL